MPSMSDDNLMKNAGLDLSSCGYQTINLLAGSKATSLFSSLPLLLHLRPAVPPTPLLHGCQLDCSSSSRLQANLNARSRELCLH
jgi:hypothetical protein